MTSSPSNPVEDFRPRLEEVFGRKHLGFLDECQVEVHDGTERSFAYVGVGEKPKLSFHKHDVGNVYIVVHEVAHAYHGYHFPILTEVVPRYRAEACALLAEHMLGTPTTPAEQRLFDSRLAIWREQLDVMEVTMRAMRVGADKGWHLKTAFEHILFGEFDGGERQDQCEGNA